MGYFHWEKQMWVNLLSLTRYLIFASGSPPILGDESDDVDADDASDVNYPTSGNQDHKHKIAERMLTWRMNSGRNDDIVHSKYDSGEIGHPKYDSGEIPRIYIPSLTHSQVC